MKSRNHIKLKHTKSNQLNSMRAFINLLLILSASLINGCAVSNYTTTKSNATVPVFEEDVKFYLSETKISETKGHPGVFIGEEREGLKSFNTAKQDILRVEKIRKDLIELSPVLFSETENAIPIKIQVDFALTDYALATILIMIGTGTLAPLIFPVPLPWFENDCNVTVEIEDKFTGLYKCSKYSFSCSYLRWQSFFSPSALLMKESEQSVTVKFNQYYSRKLPYNNIYIPLYEVTRESIVNCILESISSCNKAEIFRAYSLRKKMKDDSK